MIDDGFRPPKIETKEEILGYPYHDFWLRSVFEHPMDDYEALLNKVSPLRISALLMDYCADSLSWIPTRNPAFPGAPPTVGLHFYGPTAIDHTGAPVFRQICLGWASLFSAGPPTLILNGGISMLINENGNQEAIHHKLLVDRDAIAQSFQELAHYAEQAANGTFYILHLGI